MLVGNNKFKYVFIAIPKTGTRSIYNVLRREFEGHLIRDHEKKIPEKFKGWFSFTVIRNPYERLVSAWWSTTQRGVDPKGFIKRLKGNASFENFCKNLPSLETVRSAPHLTPQFQWLNNDFDKIIEYENLEEEWLKLPFNENKVQLIHINSTRKLEGERNKIVRKHYTEYLNPTIIDIINKFYAKDFKQLNYKMIK